MKKMEQLKIPETITAGVLAIRARRKDLVSGGIERFGNYRLKAAAENLVAATIHSQAATKSQPQPHRALQYSEHIADGLTTRTWEFDGNHPGRTSFSKRKAGWNRHVVIVMYLDDTVSVQAIEYASGEGGNIEEGTISQYPDPQMDASLMSRSRATAFLDAAAEHLRHHPEDVQIPVASLSS